MDDRIEEAAKRCWDDDGWRPSGSDPSREYIDGFKAGFAYAVQLPQRVAELEARIAELEDQRDSRDPPREYD